MTENQELIIQHNGQMLVRDKPSEYAVANRESVIKSLLGTPTFRCALTTTSDLLYCNSRLYVVTAIPKFDLTTEWAVRGSDDEIYETPVFASSELSTRATRPYTPLIPTVLITSILASNIGGNYDVSQSSKSYMFGMSSLPPAPGSDEAIRRFHAFPLANTDSSGWLCTGPTVPSTNIYQVAVEHIRQWNENNWQGDLWVGQTEKQARCDRIVRYDAHTHQQIVDLGLEEEEMLSNMPAVAPGLPAEVLNAAWEVGHAPVNTTV